VRLFQAFLIALLMSSQLHWCRPGYELPGGETCFTCPSLGHEIEAVSKVVLQASHGDCHDCCTLNSCDRGDHPQAAKVITNPLSVDICLPIPFEIVIHDFEVEFYSIPHVETAPAHGPPSFALSRGPPCFALA
jgi:hypothetical protein